MKKQIILGSCVVLGLMSGMGINQAFGDSKADLMRNSRTKAISSIYLKEAKTTQELRKTLDTILAADLKKLSSAMDTDMVLKKDYARYKAEIKAVMSDVRLPLKKKMELVENLSQKNVDIFTKLFRVAGIDEKNTSMKIENTIRTYAKQSGQRYEFSNKGFLSYSWRFLRGGTQESAPADQEIILAPPYVFSDSERNGGGEVRADLENGRFSAASNRMIVGGHDNRSGLGHFVEVPVGGFNKIKVVAALPETDVYLSAFSDIFGAGGASAQSSIDVMSDNEIVCRENYDHGWVLAPVLWLVRESSTDTVNVSCEFNAPRAGTEIVVHFESTASVWAGGIAFSNSSVYAEPRDIKVKFSRR